MGDRFYAAQQGKTETGQKIKSGSVTKSKRRFKKDVIADINKLLSTEISGLDKCTIATLDELTEAIREVL